MPIKRDFPTSKGNAYSFIDNRCIELCQSAFADHGCGLLTDRELIEQIKKYVSDRDSVRNAIYDYLNYPEID